MAKNTILALIVVFAFVFRISLLDRVPPSLFADEVDIAYQVKVFKTTGTDYFGNKYPIHFHSFSDWRTSLQIYSSIIVSNFTDNDIYIVRLPSVIYSTIGVYLIYLITGSLSAPFLLAISPWSIHYGRTGFEVSGMITCLLAAIYFYKTKKYYLFSLFLCLSPYFYSTAKLFVPIILFLFLVKHKNYKLFLLSFLLLLPMGIDTLKGHSGFRFSYINVFSLPHREQITDTLRYQDVLLSHSNEIGVVTPLYSKIFHNKLVLSLNKFIENYFASFSTSFLFSTGDSNVRHGFGTHGLLYIIDFFTLFIGLFIYKNKPTKLGHLFFYLLILAPIPFALTRDSIGPHSTRLILILPSLIYFSSLGLKKYKYLIIIYLLLFINFWHYYTIHYPQDTANVWHYNMANSVVESQKYSYSQIYYSDKYEPFLPFFLNYFPYLKNINLNITDTTYFSGKNLDNKYFFGNINLSNINLFPKNSLFIIPEIDNSQVTNLTLLKKIPKTYEMSQNFYIYTNNEK
ncbi:MAG: hypothetical protein WC069_02360 [Candidatus Shapirobacteria bacterium]